METGIKKILKHVLIGLMLIFSTSCVVSQTIPYNYKHVYFDYVVTGIVRGDNFINDGFNSYHVITHIPKNTYYLLLPVGNDVYIYNKTRTYKRLYKHEKNWMFYNRQRHHVHNKPVPPKIKYKHRR